MSEADQQKEDERSIHALKMALVSADPDRYLPIVYGEESSRAPAPIMEDDYSDIISEDGILDTDATLVYANVPDLDEVAELMRMLEDQGGVLKAPQINEGLKADGWR